VSAQIASLNCSPRIEAEYLNTPRLVADSTATTVWRWDQAEPFGVNAANEDPDGNSVAFDLPLRLPGQYYDKETGLHQNYFRDYDTGLGRYIQSDPIGLRGGINTFLYAKSPLIQVDPFGLMGQGPSSGSVRNVYRPRSVCGSGALTGPEFNFREACQNHDDCYATCRANKLVCDAKFDFDLKGSCRPGDWLCLTLATVYHSAVVIGGGGAYDDAQAEACKKGAPCRPN